MFTKLTNFGLKRNFSQALGFYLFSLFSTVILAGLISGLFSLFIQDNNFIIGVRIGMLVTFIMTLMFSYLILKAKKLLNNKLYVIMALLSLIISFYGGAIFSLIIVAWLTTK